MQIIKEIMKKVCVFLLVLVNIIAISSCQSRLSKSSNSVDSVSYAIGAVWGYSVLMDKVQFIDVNNAIKELKKTVKIPISGENNIYTISAQFRELLQKSPQRVFSEQEKQHISTLLGALWAHQLHETNIPQLNLKYTKQGIKDMMKNDTAAVQLSIEEASSYIFNYKMRIDKKDNEKRLEEGRTFLEKNKNEQGIVTTESGLQYKVIKQGDDKKITATDSAYINITITDIKGDTIDTQSKAYYLEEKHFIKGLWEGLQLFGEDAEFILYIPSELAFGETLEPWITQRIKPNMTLIYHIEIKKIINNNFKSKIK
jgi:FKBP-type peptidyl-prolyl cis-trans isomerase